MLNNYVLLNYLDQALMPENYQDYCPNGLQIEGTSNIKRIIGGVSLSMELIDKAIDDQAEAIIVHHGIFWRKDDYTLIGVKKQRIEKLIQHKINLYAYHLPLDNHITLGNNIGLARLLEIEVQGQCGEQGLIWYGQLARAIPLIEFCQIIADKLDRQPLCFSHDEHKMVTKVAWCTGGADGFFIDAIKLGVDVYISGEAAEPTMALAKESKVAFISAGHYASERYGIQALINHVSQHFDLPAKYIELYNPV